MLGASATKAFFLSLWTLLPGDVVVSDQVDVIEINHVYDDDGQHVFDQTIYWNWDYLAERHQVIAWRMAKKPSILPVRGRAVWMDGETLRDVRSLSVSETWTQYDRELEERKNIEPCNRQGLSGEKVSPR